MVYLRKSGVACERFRNARKVREAMEVLIGTTNPSKEAMFARLLEGCGVLLRTPRDLGITAQPEEEGRTPEENAVLKARFYGQYFDPVLCNDSGLYFECMPRDDPRQPWLHIRTPQGGPRLNDDEMIAYYSSLVRSLGGRVPASYPDAFAVCRAGKIYSFMETGEGHNSFYMVDTPAATRHPGWPLDSLSLYRYSGAYFVDEAEDSALPQEALLRGRAYHRRLVRFLRESLGIT